MSKRQLRHSFRIHNECQAWPRDYNILNVLVYRVSHEANEAEHDKASKEACDAVSSGNKDGITKSVVVELVVGCQSYQGPPAWP